MKHVTTFWKQINSHNQILEPCYFKTVYLPQTKVPVRDELGMAGFHEAEFNLVMQARHHPPHSIAGKSSFI